MSNVANNLKHDLEPLDIGSRLPDGIREQLMRFYQLRRGLRVLGGVSGWFIVGVVAILAAVLLDAFWVVSAARPLASCLFYGAILIAAWPMVARPWLSRSPDWLREATLLERRSGRLRNLLVSAVELASIPVPPGTSSEFSARVQDDAEEAVGSLDMREVVSQRPRQAAIRRLQMTAVLLVAGCLAPWIQLPSRMARILLPLANLGRSSWVSIDVIHPLPHNKTIARGDVVTIEAEFSGPWKGQARIETRWSTGSQSEAMVAIEQGNAAKGAVSTDQPWLEYRVTSQNAASPWYRLDARERPSVRDLVGRVKPPEAVASADAPGFTTPLSADQPLRVLRGSRIELQASSEFPLAVAEIQWQDGFAANPQERDDGESDAVDVRALSFVNDAGELSVEFVASESGRFRVHLVDADTALSNRFSTIYEIEAVEDRPADLVWLTPETTDHLVARGDLVDLQLSASDELPLESCEINVRINGSQWQPVADVVREELVQEERLGAELSIHARVDVTQLSARYGDLIEFEGSAKDAAGNESRSRTLRMTVVAERSQPLIGPSDELQFDVANRLDEFADKLEKYVSGPARQSLRAQELVTGIQADLRQLIAFTLSTSGSLQALESRSAVRFIGGCLADLNGQLAAHLARLQKTTVDSPNDRDDVRLLAPELRTTTDDFRAVLAARVGRSIAEAIRQISGSQQAVAARAVELAQTDSGNAGYVDKDDAGGADVLTLARMQTAILYQVENVQLLITDAARKLPENNATILAQIAQRLDTASSGIRREGSDTNIRALSHNAAILNSELLRLGMTQAIFPDWTGQLNRHLGQLTRRSAAPEVARKLANAIMQSDDAARSHLTEAFALRYEVRRSFRRASSPGDGPFASDMGLANRAVRAQSETLSGRALADRLVEIEAAAQTLLAADVTERARLIFDELRGDGPPRTISVTGDGVAAAELRLLTWCIAAGTMPAAHTSLAASGYSHELTQQLIHLSGKMQDGALRHYFASVAPASGAIDSNLRTARTRFLTIAEGMDEIRSPMQVHATAARELLRSLSPSVVDLAIEAAERTRQTSLITGDLAGATERDTAASVQSEIQRLASDLSRPEEAIEQLRDALIDLAESQNLLDSGQIETAKLADQAREQVDVASEQLSESLAGVDPSAPDAELAEQLRDGAEKQKIASERLAQVAEQLATQLPKPPAEDSPDAMASTADPENASSGENSLSGAPSVTEESESSQGAGSSNQPGDPNSQAPSSSQSPSSNRSSASGSPNGESSTEQESQKADAYQEAEELAEFASKSPEDMLAELEAYLPTSSPMQRELSSISEAAVSDALEQIDAARARYERLSTELRLSDIATEVSSQELLLEATYANTILRDVSMHLLDQTRAAMVLAKEDAAARSLQTLQREMKSQLESIGAQQAAIRNSNEASAERPPQNTLRWIESQRSAAQALADAATEQLAMVGTLKDKSIHSQPRELRSAAQDASDRLRRTTQLLARLTRGHKRLRTQQLEQAQRRLETLSVDIDRRQKQLETNLAGQPETMQRAKRQLARDRQLQAAQQQQVVRLEAKVGAADAEIRAANEIAPLKPQSDNPAAELAGELLEELQRTSKLVADQLGELSAEPHRPRVAEAAIERHQDVPAQTAVLLQSAQKAIDRAMRHEQRLGSSERAQELAGISAGASQLATSSSEQASAAFASGLIAARSKNPNPGQVPEQESAEAIKQVDTLGREADMLVTRLSAFLGGTPAEPSTKAKMSKPPVPMQPDELANLLDQLDRQLNQSQELGQRDNDSDGAPNATSSQPQQLSKSASQIAQSLAMGRQTPTEQTSGDLAMATESLQADVRPQGPTAVQMLDVDRLSGSWGQLRERTNDDALEDARLGVPAQYRSQVDAYFRRLGAAARPEVSDAK